MESGLTLLRAGEVIALFPEGDLYVDGRLREFGRGLGFFALRSGAPVLPVGITGADGVWRDGRFRRPQVRMVVGMPVDLTGVDGAGARAYAQAAERVRAAVASLRDGRPDPPS